MAIYEKSGLTKKDFGIAMSKVSYFQRFSQRENHVTNNTLLVMRHFYQASPQKISAVLSELVGHDLAVGLTFEQQIKSSDSVPDALILQTPLNIYIETKRGGELDKKQIKRHIASIANKRKQHPPKILIGLTQSPIKEDVKEELKKNAQRKKIIFATTTFSEIVNALRKQCSPYEKLLYDILSDYEKYLINEELMQIGDSLTIVPCRKSKHENVKFGLYFDPARRPVRVKSKFFGIYDNRCVHYLADVKTVVVGTWTKKGGFALKSIEKGEFSKDQKKRITDAIVACTYYPNFARERTRYYLFGEVCETEIRKTTRYGIRNSLILNMSKWLDYNNDPTKTYSTREAARLLEGQGFE